MDRDDGGAGETEHTAPPPDAAPPGETEHFFINPSIGVVYVFYLKLVLDDDYCLKATL
jgi:hypothetical protein